MEQTTNSTTGQIILSPVPLAPEVRETYTENPTTFLDLFSLRRGGVAAALRTLRSYRPSRIILTGEEADLAVFRDALVLAALAIPSSDRRYARPGLEPVPLDWWNFPVALGRILFGITAGLAALLANMVRLHRISRAEPARLTTGRVLDRCLYLKSALNFGVLVGGSVGHVAGVANALHRAGKQIKLVAMAKQPMVDSKVHQTLVVPDSLPAFPHELNLFRYHRKYLRAVMRQVRDFRPDFVYQRYSLDDFSGICLRRWMHIPLILEFNGSETWIQRHWGTPLRFDGISERIEQANLRCADLVVVVSEEIKKQVCSVGVPEERVLFYPNCVDTSLFDPERFDAATLRKVRQDLGVPTDADLFTFVGTFGRWHGTDVLAESIRRLVDSERGFLEDHRIHFLLVGDGLYGQKVRSILKGIPFVSLPGFRPQDETPAILAASDVCLSPHVPNPDGTPFFGSPTKLFEYMVMGKLIVASDLDQIGWVLRGWRPGNPAPSIHDRRNAAALLIEPGNLDSLIQGIHTAAEMSPSARSEIGMRARKLVLESFTWDRNVNAVLNRFEQLLREQSRTEHGAVQENVLLT